MNGVANLAAYRSQTKVVIPVHFAGSAVDMDPILELAKKQGVAIVEDAAHAAGTFYKGRRVGKTGTSIFSFHPIKNMTTGEGGMFCSDDAVLVERIRRLKFHCLGVDAFDRQMQGRSPQAEVLEPGYKYNMTDISAVLGLRQLARLEEFNAKRTDLAMLYRRRLAEIDELIPLADAKYPVRHVWHLFIVRLDTDKGGMSRDDFMKELKARNIGTGLHFRAVHLQKYYIEKMGMRRGMLPNTEWNSDRICSLPIFPNMTGQDVDDVVNAIKEVLKKSSCAAVASSRGSRTPTRCRPVRDRLMTWTGKTSASCPRPSENSLASSRHPGRCPLCRRPGRPPDAARSREGYGCRPSVIVGVEDDVGALTLDMAAVKAGLEEEERAHKRAAERARGRR